MDKLFNLDNPVMRFMSRLFDLMYLNVLFVICCIPVITIGASLTALYSVTLKMVKNEETYIGRDFFKSFRMNFKQGTIIWLITVVAGAILAADYQLVTQMSMKGSSVLRIGILSISLICFCMFIYVFPLLARFVNTVKVTIKNSLLMCIAHLPYTALFVLIRAIIIFIATRSEYSLFTTMFLASVGGCSAVTFIESVLFRKIFKRYEPEEEVYEDTYYEHAGASEVISSETTDHPEN